MHPKMYMYKRLVDAKLFIDRHYATPIDLECIADTAYYSKYHFLRLFKKAFGKAPAQYLRDVRLQHAKQLLSTTDTTVTEACFAVGFDSVPSFTLLFKKQYGQSPKAYQRAQLEQQAQVAKQPFQFVPNCFAETYGWKERNSQ